MPEVVRESFALTNLPFTLLLCVVVIYWLAVILGMFEIEGLDGLIEEPEGTPQGSLGSILSFFHIGEVPALVVLSVFAGSLWAGSVLGNYYFNPSHSLALAALVFVPNFIAAALLTRLIASPFRKAFKLLSTNYDDDVKIIGQTCTVLTQQLDGSFGQAQIEGHGAPIVINARTTGGEILRKGDTAIVFERDEQKNICLVRKLETPELAS